MLWLLHIMMAYAASVDSQDTLLLTVARISRRVHRVLLLAVKRVAETDVPETVIPNRLLLYLAMPIMSMLRRLRMNRLS
jgi:hypothetical protein